MHDQSKIKFFPIFIALNARNLRSELESKSENINMQNYNEKR